MCYSVFLSSCKNDVIDESIPLIPVIDPIRSAIAQDGDVSTSALISKDDKTIVLLFFNETDLSNVKLNFKFKPRTKLVSISDSVATFDLRKPQELVINNLFEDVTYTIYGVFPSKLASGMRQGSDQIVWSKKLQTDLNIDVLQVTGGIAATKDYLVINTRDRASIYVDSKTGNLVDTINMNGIKGGLINFYNTNDDSDNILISNLAANAGTFKVWRVNGVNSTPELYINWSESGSTAIGRKLSINGSLDGNAIITAPILAAGNRFALWQVINGVLQSHTPELISITGTDINWGSNVDIVSSSSSDVTADLFVAYGNNPSMISWVDGNTKTIKSTSPTSTLVSNAVDYSEFNGVPYVIHNNLNAAGKDDTAHLYDLSTETGLNSPIWSLTKGTYGGINNGNSTGDVTFRISKNGFFLYAYIMYTNGSVVCVQFDCVDLEGSLPK